MTSVMPSRSAHHPDYSSYQDPHQALPVPPQDRAFEPGISGNQTFVPGSLDSLGYLPNEADTIFDHDAALPAIGAPAKSFDVDFELDLASDAFQGSSSVATPAAFGGGELKFPELPADLLDSSPEYEYSHHTRTNVFDAAQDYAGDEEADRLFNLQNTYDPTGPFPTEEELFGLTKELEEHVDPTFNSSIRYQPSIQQIGGPYYQHQEPSTHQVQWGPSPVSSFSNSAAPTPVNVDTVQRSYEEAERESKRRRESYEYSQAPPPPPPAPLMADDHSHQVNNGYVRGISGGAGSTGTNTPVGSLYSTPVYPSQNLDAVPQRTWHPNDPNDPIGRGGIPNWEEPQSAYYPHTSSLDYQQGGGGGSLFVTSSAYGGAGSSNMNNGRVGPEAGIGGHQRHLDHHPSFQQQSHQQPYSAPRLGAGKSSYIPETNGEPYHPPQYRPRPHPQPQPQPQPQTNSTARAIPNSLPAIRARLPDTFVGPGGSPVPTPGQTEIQMLDAIGDAVDASVQEEGAAQCPYPNCTKSFAKNRTYNLKAHLRQHANLKPFACTQCSRAFSRRHDLERHARVHTGDKPYVCEACKKGFPRSDALRRHWRVETDCGAQAQAMEAEREAERLANQSGGRSDYSNQQLHPTPSNPPPLSPQPESFWPKEEPEPSTSAGGARPTRNSTGTKRKR